jgi:hypothetical protein
LAEPLPEESAVVDGNGVAIAAELMDEFFHLLAKVVRAAGEWATNCHFCGVDDGGWQRRFRGVIHFARAEGKRHKCQSIRRVEGSGRDESLAPTSLSLRPQSFSGSVAFLVPAFCTRLKMRYVAAMCRF